MSENTKQVLLIFMATLLWPQTVEAEPIRVRHLEGAFRGFLVIRSLDGSPIGYGEVSQKPIADLIESRMILRFNDGSIYDELATFSQNEVFRLEAYRLVQHGPSFPAMTVSFDRLSRRYEVRSKAEQDGREEVTSGTFDMPDDLYNGMALILLKNLPGGVGAKVRIAAFLPEPRLIEMEWSWEGEDEVFLGDRALTTKRSLVKLKIGGWAGMFASFAGKSPPDLRYWIVTGDVPAFVKFEGPLFLNGPVWRLEMTALRWPH